MKNQFDTEAEVHLEISGGGYRVKVSVLGLGLYINGMVVFPPNPSHKEWGVFTPQGQSANRKFKQLEFNKSSPLWLEIKEACVEAVKSYSGMTGSFPGQALSSLSDEDFDHQVKNAKF